MLERRLPIDTEHKGQLLNRDTLWDYRSQGTNPQGGAELRGTGMALIHREGHLQFTKKISFSHSQCKSAESPSVTGCADRHSKEVPITAS
jgi:hypothetical protein